MIKVCNSSKYSNLHFGHITYLELELINDIKNITLQEMILKKTAGFSRLKRICGKISLTFSTLPSLLNVFLSTFLLFDINIFLTKDFKKYRVE